MEIPVHVNTFDVMLVSLQVDLHNLVDLNWCVCIFASGYVGYRIYPTTVTHEQHTEPILSGISATVPQLVAAGVKP